MLSPVYIKLYADDALACHKIYFKPDQDILQQDFYVCAKLMNIHLANDIWCTKECILEDNKQTTPSYLFLLHEQYIHQA